MDAALAHRALLKHNDVMKASMASRSRPTSVTWIGLLLGVGLFLAIELGHRFAFWLVQQLPFDAMFAIGRAYLRNFPKLGIPAEIDAEFEILPDGLRLTTDRITIFPKWQAIDRVERLDLGWVLSADQLTFLIPRASFADEAAEGTFIAALVDKLSPEARQRSPAAAALADRSGLA